MSYLQYKLLIIIKGSSISEPKKLKAIKVVIKMFLLPRKFFRMPITISKNTLQITLNTNIKQAQIDQMFK